jgi:hypothetical protein
LFGPETSQQLLNFFGETPTIGTPEPPSATARPIGGAVRPGTPPVSGAASPRRPTPAQQPGQINNPQQSWGFEWEPPKAVMKDSGTRDWTLWGGKLQLQLVRHLRVLDIGAGHLLVQADRCNEIPSGLLAQNLWPRKLRALRTTFCAIQVELFSFRYPITSSTEFRWL